MFATQLDQMCALFTELVSNTTPQGSRPRHGFRSLEPWDRVRHFRLLPALRAQLQSRSHRYAPRSDCRVPYSVFPVDAMSMRAKEGTGTAPPSRRFPRDAIRFTAAPAPPSPSRSRAVPKGLRHSSHATRQAGVHSVRARPRAVRTRHPRALAHRPCRGPVRARSS